MNKSSAFSLQRSAQSSELKALRSGSTLIEMMMFIGLLAMTIGVIVALLIATNDSRVRQQVVTQVEQNGVQLIQTLTRRIRSAERILGPAAGHTGSVLALQMASTAEDPTIIAMRSGALIIARSTSLQTLSSSQVTVLDLEVRNTSTATGRPSALIQFTVSKTISLPGDLTYTRPFEALITLYPDDSTQGNPCSCPPPVCDNHVYRWDVCDVSCNASPVTVPC